MAQVLIDVDVNVNKKLVQSRLDPRRAGGHKADMIYLKPCFLFSVLAALVFCSAASAQEPTGETPRQILVEQIFPRAQPAPARPKLAEPETAALLLKESNIATAKPDNIAGKEQAATAPESPPTLLPFYVSAAEYLEARGTKAAPTLILDYDITSFNLDDETKTKSQSAQLVLAADYAVFSKDGVSKIYDFKLNRLLILSRIDTGSDRAEGLQKFDNISLYAKVYRDLNLVNTVTKGGEIRHIPIGGEKQIDAFWIESAKSWAAAPQAGLDITERPDGLKIGRKQEIILDVEFATKAYGTKKFRDSFLAFAHHELPLHPAILQAVYPYDRPVKSLHILSYSPEALTGYKQIWTLKKRANKRSAFPLPASAKSVVERKPLTPLAFLVNQAARGQALGGPPSLDELLLDYGQQKDQGDALAAWISGQKYAAYSGACQGSDAKPICAELDDIAQGRAASKSYQARPERGKTDIKNTLIWRGDSKKTDFTEAFNLANDSKTRARAVMLLRPYLNKPGTPSLILRTAAMARAGLKSQDAKRAGILDVNAETLLKRALAQDPYDPQNYLGLAQVLAARGAFEQSWDIYDALRAGIAGAPAVSQKINRVEDNLLKSAPGYFMIK